MKRKFQFEFIDQSSDNTISFEYDDNIEEKIEIILENGTPVIYANQQAFFVLAKTFLKMAICNYKSGFHIHLRKDFDVEQPEIIRCTLI